MKLKYYSVNINKDKNIIIYNGKIFYVSELTK